MADAPWRILALLPLDPEIVRPILTGLDAEVTFPETRDRDGLHTAMADAEIVVGDFTGVLALDAAAVAAASRLAFVQMPQVGVDTCDLTALSAADVPVANTAGANARAVAEWTLGAAIDLSRHVSWGDRRMRSGEWSQSDLLARGTREIHIQRVGIVGFGAIGTEVARLFVALGCEVSYWSRRRRPESPAMYRGLEDLLTCSDILIVALPQTAETAGLLGPERLSLLPRGALLINVSRGGIVPESGILDALDNGHLAGAALDVYESEPPAAGHPLRSHESVLLSPHVAGATAQAQLNIVSLVTGNLRAAVNGNPVVNVVNEMDPLIRRR
jgi:D-3-phosphoglycerate dehydrogenase